MEQLVRDLARTAPKESRREGMTPQKPCELPILSRNCINLSMAKPLHMNKTLLSAFTVLLLFCVKIHAQTTTVTTWYIIPPTSGCNGVWAVDALTYGPCSAGAQYNMNPMGCVQLGGPTVADTTYLPLCAFPCDLTLINSQGQMCICSTGTVTDAPLHSSERVLTTYPNPATTAGGWNVLLHQPGENVTVNIYNSLGQLVVSQNHSQADQIVHVDISSLVAGTYTAQISVNGAVSYNQQLVVTQ